MTTLLTPQGQRERLPRFRRLLPAALLTLVAVGAGAGAVGGAVQSPRLVPVGSRTFVAFQRAVDRTTRMPMFVYRQAGRFGGRHPYVEDLTLVVDGPRHFTEIQSYGGTAFETIVDGSRSFETAAAVFTGDTTSARIARATEQLAGKFVEGPPIGLSHVLGTSGHFVVLRLIVNGVRSGSLSMSRSGSALIFSSPAVPFSGRVELDHGRVEAATLNLPDVHHEYRFERLARPVPINLPSPADIVTRNLVSGCVDGISYICVR